MQNSTDLTNLMLTEADKSLAHEIYTRFKQYPGSRHIATEFALSHLSALTRLTQPRTALEIGAGIGTQTYLLLAHTQCPSLLVATETNEFCIGQIEHNIPKYLGQRFVLVTGDDGLPDSVFGDNEDGQNGIFGNNSTFDLIVMDVDAPETLFKYMKHGSYLFVEGNRRELRTRVQEYLNGQNLEIEFTNYNRGTRPIKLIFKQTKFWLKRPKIRLNKIIKGCWIGQVSRKRVDL